MGRDGERLTKAFLGHYKDLGFKSFIFLDNNSKDGCVEHLMDEASALGCDLSIYRCNLDYKLYKHSMKNFLIASVPTGAWTFYADNDEFLVLPEGVSDVK
ncbi:MAG: glycosyltransferase family 2 protein [Pirellulales bacterium]